jgi:hypothetical protein
MKPFELNASIGQFTSCGSPKDKRGVTHTAFMAKPGTGAKVVAADPYEASGVCTVYTLYDSGVAVGILMESPSAITVVRAHVVTVEVPQHSSFTPLYKYDRLNIVMFIGDNGSVVAVPQSAQATLLIPVTESDDE